MRGKVAKLIRKICREHSVPTEYKTVNGSVVTEGFRKKCQGVKKIYKSTKLTSFDLNHIEV